jgi:hypothetical protein
MVNQQVGDFSVSVVDRLGLMCEDSAERGVSCGSISFRVPSSQADAGGLVGEREGWREMG